jgi:hypothetical protein
MDIVGGFDVHRKQITFDYVEIETGESRRGEIRPADREHLRSWLEQFAQRLCGREAAFALEATTGWRYVVEELGRVGVEAHLAEPADTKALQGRKKRAKTDRIDARHLRELLLIDRLPESWIPPEHVQEIRTLMRIRHSMIEERAAHQQRIHAQLFHNGCPQEKNLLSAEGLQRLQQVGLPRAARKVVDLCLKMIDGRFSSSSWAASKERAAASVSEVRTPHRSSCSRRARKRRRPSTEIRLGVHLPLVVRESSLDFVPQPPSACERAPPTESGMEKYNCTRV